MRYAIAGLKLLIWLAACLVGLAIAVPVATWFWVAKDLPDPRAVLMATVIGGSLAYATPIGMPANVMVLGPGRYTFMDYTRAGLPLILVSTVVAMILLPILFPFFP